MPIEKVSEADKAEMRSVIQTALLEGVNLEELSEIYDLIRDQYKETYSMHQISGTIAYKYTPEDELVLETDEEAIKRYQEHARKKIDVVTKENTTLQEEVITGSSDSEEQINGESMNYDFEKKRKWRKKWAEFIDENTEVEKRKDMRVLCLPGRKCLEIPLYLELGFRPENITAVERVNSQEFLQSAQLYGIRAVIGEMKDYLKDKDSLSGAREPYDVVSLDFHGQFSNVHTEILALLPLAKESLLLLNQLAKRERTATMSVMEMYAMPIHVEGAISDDVWRQRLELMGAIVKNGHQLEGHTIRDQAPINTILTLAGMAGRKRNIDLTQFSMPSFREWVENFDGEATWNQRGKAILIFKSIINEYMGNISFPGPFEQKAVANGVAEITNFVLDRVLCNPRIPMAVRQYKYTNPNRSNFFSTFVRLYNTAEDLHNVRYTAEFIRHSVIEQFHNLIDPNVVDDKGKIVIRDKNKQMVRPNIVSPADHICYQINESFKSSIKVKRFFQDLLYMTSVYDKQVYNKEMHLREEL